MSTQNPLTRTIPRRQSSSSGTFSPLMRAAAIGQKHLVEELIDRGANVNEKGPRDSTALMFAAGGGHLEVVRVLVEKGADLSATEHGGWSAMMHAAIDGHRDIVDFLERIAK